MSDKYIDKIEKYNVYLLAYMRDVTNPLHHDIQCYNNKSKIIGRAFTVKGPDIYINALESITENSIYVHVQTSDQEGVFSGALAKLYGKKRNLKAAIIDGGIYNRESLKDTDIPIFARFICPRGAINRENGIIQSSVVCGGVTINPGDIICGDTDGVVVIPKKNEEEIYEKIDGLMFGIKLFRGIAAEPGVIVSENEALKELLEKKYKNPFDYWRYYGPWAEKWSKKYKYIINDKDDMDMK